MTAAGPTIARPPVPNSEQNNSGSKKTPEDSPIRPDSVYNTALA